MLQKVSTNQLKQLKKKEITKMNLSDLQYKISKDYNKLTKEQKDEFKKKLYDIIVADLAVEFLTDRTWNDEQFLERFSTTDRHKILASNIHQYKVNMKVLEWIERYGDQAQELLAEYKITPPREHRFIYTVELYDSYNEGVFDLQYCSQSYEDSLSELKGLSHHFQEHKTVLVAWLDGRPQFEQWSVQNVVSDKIAYNDDYGKLAFKRFRLDFLEKF